MNRLYYFIPLILFTIFAVYCSNNDSGIIDQQDKTAANDSSPLKIIEAFPMDGSEVSVLDSVVLIFSAELDCSTVTPENITVGPGSPGEIKCDSNLAVFVPSMAYDFGVLMSVHVSKNISSADGAELEDDFDYVFYTQVEPGK